MSNKDSGIIRLFEKPNNDYMNKSLAESIKKVYKIKETFKWQDRCNNFSELSSVLPPTVRIIVIGDLHGDWNKMIKIYKKAGLIDRDYTSENYKTSLKWTGGRTIVVQLGDQIDSCRITNKNESCKFESTTKNDKSDDINILNFNTDLHKLAEDDSGAIYSLLGNHELMNVEGNFDYVSYKNILDYSKNYGTRYKSFDSDENNFKESINERITHFKPGNKMANFLACTRQVILVIGSNLFVHAGIVPSLVEKLKKDGINIINDSMRFYLLGLLNDKDKENLSDIFSNSKESPLWNRVYQSKILNEKSDKNCEDLLGPITQYWKVGKIFVGHTPQMDTGIRKVCNDRINFVDYGSSKAFDPWKKDDVKDIQYIEILNDKEVIVHKYD